MQLGPTIVLKTDTETLLSTIASLHPSLNEADAKIGAQLMLRYKDRFQDLNGSLAQHFIKFSLLALIAQDKQKSVLSTQAVVSSSSSIGPSNEDTIQSDTLPEKENISLNIGRPIILSKKTKEIANIKLFKDLAGSKSALKANARLNQFVMLLASPDLPRRHPGADDSYHPEKNMDEPTQDILERGANTLKVLSKSGSGKPCNRLIFLRGPVKSDEDPLTQEIHQGHTLDVFADIIKKERQLPTEIHFAGHGNDTVVGPMLLETRISPEELADRFEQILDLSGLKDTLKSKKLKFVFHVCNAAYTNVTPDSEESEIKEKVLNQSVMGRFYKRMIELGFTNILVEGYRGFYVAMNNGAGIRIVDKLQSASQREFDAAKALHAIERNAGKDVVTIPTGKNGVYATFPVELPTTRTSVSTSLDKV